jgi:hypothetical protein
VEEVISALEARWANARSGEYRRLIPSKGSKHDESVNYAFRRLLYDLNRDLDADHPLNIDIWNLVDLLADGKRTFYSSCKRKITSRVYVILRCIRNIDSAKLRLNWRKSRLSPIRFMSTKAQRSGFYARTSWRMGETKSVETEMPALTIHNAEIAISALRVRWISKEGNYHALMPGLDDKYDFGANLALRILLHELLRELYPGDRYKKLVFNVLKILSEKDDFS